mgnify:CR=1 FL=1
MRLTEYIDYLNNGAKNEKRYSHYTIKSKRFMDNKIFNADETTAKK